MFSLLLENVVHRLSGGMSSRPLRQVADAASEIQAVVGTSQSGNVDQGSSLANIFTPEEIKRINEMANQLLETVRQRQRNQPQGTQSPQESYVQDVNIFNGVCSVLTRCGTGIAHAAGWVGNGLYYAGRRTGSELSANRGFALMYVAELTKPGLVVCFTDESIVEPLLLSDFSRWSLESRSVLPNIMEDRQLTGLTRQILRLHRLPVKLRTEDCSSHILGLSFEVKHRRV